MLVAKVCRPDIKCELIKIYIYLRCAVCSSVSVRLGASASARSR